MTLLAARFGARRRRARCRSLLEILLLSGRLCPECSAAAPPARRARAGAAGRRPLAVSGALAPPERRGGGRRRQRQFRMRIRHCCVGNSEQPLRCWASVRTVPLAATKQCRLAGRGAATATLLRAALLRLPCCCCCCFKLPEPVAEEAQPVGTVVSAERPATLSEQQLLLRHGERHGELAGDRGGCQPAVAAAGALAFLPLARRAELSAHLARVERETQQARRER